MRMLNGDMCKKLLRDRKGELRAEFQVQRMKFSSLKKIVFTIVHGKINIVKCLKGTFFCIESLPTILNIGIEGSAIVWEYKEDISFPQIEFTSNIALIRALINTNLQLSQ